MKLTMNWSAALACTVMVISFLGLVGYLTWLGHRSRKLDTARQADHDKFMEGRRAFDREREGK